MAASYELSPASEEDPRRETAVPDSYTSPEVWCRKETLRARKAEDWCFQKGTLQTKMSNEAADGLARSVFDIFQAQVKRILAFFRQRARKTRGGKLRVQVRVVLLPEAWCFRTGTLQAHILARFLTILSNTPQRKWCCSGSPIIFFTMVPFVVCHG